MRTPFRWLQRALLALVLPLCASGAVAEDLNIYSARQEALMEMDRQAVPAGDANMAQHQHNQRIAGGHERIEVAADDPHYNVADL